MNRKRQFRRKGFTLVELMGAMVISMAIILMLYKVFDKVQSVFVVSLNRARAMEQGRIGMDMLVRDFTALSAVGLNTLDGPVANIDWVEGGVGAVGSVSPFSDPAVEPQDFFGHHFRFFTNDEDWRYVDYKFASRENYKSSNLASPVGALWVYRSRVVPRAGLIDEIDDHAISKNSDEILRVDQRVQITGGEFAGLQGICEEVMPGKIRVNMDNGDTQELDKANVLGFLDEPAGYARVIDGVVSFRVRAASPRPPFGLEAWSAISYTGSLVPSHVEVELAVVGEKLVAEMEQGIGQRMEGEAPEAIYAEKVKFLNENLDRVYFYKQLIRIKRRGL